MKKNIKEVEITVEGKEWQDALDKAFKKKNKTAKIDGFRPGKAPKEVFIKKYGIESLFIDAGDLVLEDAYKKVIGDNKEILDDLVARPEIELKSVDENKIEFKFILTLKPEVKLGKYKGLGVKKEEAKATKKEIEDAIENMRKRYAEDIIKEGAIENGDIAIIDFEGFVDGEAFDGGKAENYSLTVGSDTFIPGFEEQLIGLKEGDEKDVKVTFPKDYHAEDLKGKDAVFKVKVHEVKEVHIPDIDEDFFADLGMEGVDTKEALEAQISESIITRKEAEFENKYIDELLEKAAENTEVEIPEVMIDEELDRMIRQYGEHLQMQGLTLEQFYKFTNSDEMALRDQMREEATKRITYRLMLEEIAKEEKIEISDKEAEEEADKMAEKYQMKKDEFLNAFGGLDMIKYDMKMRRAMEVLKED